MDIEYNEEYVTNKEESEEENIYNEELVRQRFASSIDAYKDYVLNIHDKNKQNASMNDVMMAFTKTLKNHQYYFVKIIESKIVISLRANS